MGRFDVFLKLSAGTFRFDNSTWLTWLGATVAAGCLFGLAASLPFTKVRYLPSRILLAALVLLPLIRFWWVTIQGHGGSIGWLTGTNWFDRIEMQFALAVLAGVAIASGVVERRGR